MRAQRTVGPVAHKKSSINAAPIIGWEAVNPAKYPTYSVIGPGILGQIERAKKTKTDEEQRIKKTLKKVENKEKKVSENIEKKASKKKPLTTKKK